MFAVSAETERDAHSGKRLDTAFLKFVIVGFFASCSVSRLALVLDKSSSHIALVYWDFIFVFVLALFGILGLLLFGRERGATGAGWMAWPLFGLTTWCGISGLLFAQNGALFASGILQYANAVLLALLLPSLLLRHRLANFSMDAFLAFSVGVSLIALVEGVLEPRDFFADITSTLSPNRSHIGLYMMTALATGLYRLSAGGGHWHAAATVLAFSSIMISGSRAALIGCAPILIAYFFRRISFTNILKLVAGFVLIFLVMSYIISSRSAEVPVGSQEGSSSFEVTDDVAIDKSAGRRVLIWVATWKAITDPRESFWTGFGFSNYRWEYGKSIRLFFYTNGAHNVFLHMWAETGLIGLLLFMGFFGGILMFSWKWKSRHPGSLVLGGLALGVLFTGLTQESFYPNEATANFPTLFVFACLLMCAAAIQEQKSKGTTASVEDPP
jgi:O-antigen ligase